MKIIKKNYLAKSIFLVKNFYFNNFNFGNTKISSEIFNNKMVRLNGDVYDNEKNMAFLIIY